MNQEQCGGRDCIESIEAPGFCVWCNERMPICPVCKARCSSFDTMLQHIERDHPAHHLRELAAKELQRSISAASARRPYMPPAVEQSFSLSEQGQRASLAIAELAACGSQVCVLLDAVEHGATLILSGADQRINGTLRNGNRMSRAAGGSVVQVVSELVASWQRYADHPITVGPLREQGQ